MDDVLGFSIQLALQAGQLLRENFRSTGTRASVKADHSVVTEVDLAADRLISTAIQSAYPDDLLLSEELAQTLPNSTDVHSQAVWVIDPLDGTTNYSLGLIHWGVLIARLVNGWPDVACMYFPLIDELYSAQHEQGAWLNGQRLQVRAPDPQQPAAFFACCSRTYRMFTVDLRYKPRILGSAAYNLCCVARSSALLAFEVTPKIWDIAAGWLFLKEAGGCVETYDGSRPFPIQAGADYSRLNFPVLAAATPELLDRARRDIRPKK